MLGDLSKRYESNGNPGCISSGLGDAGGKSYGMYQMSSRMGVVDDYIQWLYNNNYWFAGNLAETPLAPQASTALGVGSHAAPTEAISRHHNIITSGIHITNPLLRPCVTQCMT